MGRTLNLIQSIDDDDAGITYDADGLSITTTGDFLDHRRLSIAITETTVTIASAITGGGNGPGVCKIKNNGVNYVQIGFATTAYFLRIGAGEEMTLLLEPDVTQLFMKANTAAVEIEINIFER